MVLEAQEPAQDLRTDARELFGKARGWAAIRPPAVEVCLPTLTGTCRTVRTASRR